MKKLFANFGFPNHSCTDSACQDFDTYPYQPTVALDRVSLKHSMIQVDMRGGDSRFILGMDPVGESLICAEMVAESQKWRVLGVEELAILMIEHLMQHMRVNAQIKSDEKLSIVVTGEGGEMVREYCQNREIDSGGDGRVIMRVDLDRQAFAFGAIGTFDALNASIILS